MTPEKHGLRKVPEYKVWANMKNRCLNPNTPDFKYYGAKGVTVCDEWINSFKSFYDHIGSRPDGMTLDRIENTRGYEPGNVRWATRQTQAENRGRFKNNVSGVKGVHWDTAKRKWVAQIGRGSVRKWLGVFDDFSEAHKARQRAENEARNQA